MALWRLFYHLVWTTKFRAPLIDEEWEQRLLRLMAQQAADLNGTILASGNVEDHVHLLATIPPACSASIFVKQLKGSSSRFVSKEFGIPFEWQRGYGIFSISERDVPQIKEYVLNQKQRHADGLLIPKLEACPEWNFGPGDEYPPAEST